MYENEKKTKKTKLEKINQSRSGVFSSSVDYLSYRFSKWDSFAGCCSGIIRCVSKHDYQFLNEI